MTRQSDLEALGAQMHDTMINPLADVVIRLLQVLANNGTISKEQAIACTALGVSVLNDLSYSQDVIDQGADQLMRMVKAIDSGVEPGRPLT